MYHLAVDGYHAVELDSESQPSTTFISEWGRYMYLCLPYLFITAGDAYTHCYDNIIKDVPHKVKIMDDTLLYDKTNEDFFYHTATYPEGLCYRSTGMGSQILTPN